MTLEKKSLVIGRNLFQRKKLLEQIAEEFLLKLLLLLVL
jgi:hypothetical protein